MRSAGLLVVPDHVVHVGHVGNAKGRTMGRPPRVYTREASNLGTSPGPSDLG